MNRIYKVIWNKAKHCYVVVSELAKSRTKSPSVGRAVRGSLAAVIAATVISGGMMFMMPSALAAEPEAAATSLNQYVAYKGTNPQEGYYYDSKTGYCVKEGYEITVHNDGTKYTPLSSTGNRVDVKWVGKGNKPDEVIESVQSVVGSTGITTNLGETLNEVNVGTYSGVSNTGGTEVPSSWNYIIEDSSWAKSNLISANNKSGNWVDLTGNMNRAFVTTGTNSKLVWHEDTKSYTYDGKAVDLKNMYVIGGKLGVFTNASGTAVYTGNVYGKNNEILMTANKNGTYYSYWGAKIEDDPGATMDTYKVSDYKKDLQEFIDNEEKLKNNDIKRISAEKTDNSLKLGLMRNGIDGQEEAVDGAVTITGGGGQQENGKYVDTYVTISSGEGENAVSQTFNTGSKVTAFGETNKEDTKDNVGITINGEKYTIEAGDNVHFNAVDPNKYILSVDANDAAVIYDENNDSLKSTNSKEVGSGSVALGKDAIAKNNAVAIGDYSKANANGTVAIGFKAQSASQANQAVTLGYNSYVGKTSAIAIGANSSVDSAYEVSVGHKKGDLLGDGTRATDDLTRKIVNVSAGVNDTDAVNVAQLKQAQTALEESSYKGWKLTTTNKSGEKPVTSDAVTIGSEDTVDFSGDKNITVSNDGKNVSVKLSDKLVGINSINGFDIVTGVTATNNNGNINITTKEDTNAGSFTINGVTMKDHIASGLSNIDWNATDADKDVTEGGYKNSTKAATESQLQQAISSVNTNVDNKTFGLSADEGTKVDKKLGESIKVAGGKNITTKADGNELTVDLDDNITLGEGATQVQINGKPGSAGLPSIAVGEKNANGNYNFAVGQNGSISSNVVNSLVDNKFTFDENGITVSTKVNGKNKGDTVINGDTIVTTNENGGFTTIDGNKISTGTIIISGENNTINGLKNTTWNGTTDDVSRAATEGQLKDLDKQWTDKDKGNVKYDINPDGSINYDSVTFAGTAYTGLGTDGKYHGGTHVYNVAYASGKRGDEAVNVDYLNDKVTEIENNTASSEKHIDTSKGYTVDSNGQIKLDEVNGNDKPTGNQVIINDVASKAQQDKNTAAIGKINDTIGASGKDGLTDDYKDTNYLKESNTLVDADKALDAAIKQNSDRISSVEESAKKHTTVTNTDKNITIKESLNDKGGTNYELGLNDDITLGGKEGQTGSITVEGSKGNITATGDITAGGTVTGSDFKAGDITVNKDNSGEVSGLHNTSWDDKLAEKVAADKKDNEGKGAASTAATQGQLGDVDTKVNNNTTMINNNTVNIQNNSNRITNLEKRMGDVEERIDKVGAMAAAMANLHTMGYDPAAPTEISAGIGQYKGETALAVGFFHYPNQDFMVSGSISVAGDEVMAGVGATWKIGRKSQAQLDAREAEKRIEKAAAIKRAAKDAEVKAQAQRHAQLLAEREAHHAEAAADTAAAANA